MLPHMALLWPFPSHTRIPIPLSYSLSQFPSLTHSLSSFVQTGALLRSIDFPRIPGLPIMPLTLLYGFMVTDSLCPVESGQGPLCVPLLQSP